MIIKQSVCRCVKVVQFNWERTLIGTSHNSVGKQSKRDNYNRFADTGLLIRNNPFSNHRFVV